MTAELLYRFARLCEAEAREAAVDAQVAVVFERNRKAARAFNEKARDLRDTAFAARRRARAMLQS